MRTWMLGVGLIGCVSSAGSLFAQGFAADRGDPVPTRTALPPTRSTVPATSPQPAAPQSPAPAAEAHPSPVAVAQTHPLAVRPEHGPYMICVKSYTGPQSRQLAEELVADIRKNHKAAAYLFEWGAEEKRKEEARQDAYRDAWKKQNAPFLQLREEMRKKAEVEGRIFVDTPVTVRVPKVKFTEQWAVLIGGFPDMEKASEALKYLRTLKPPTDKEHLLDRAAVATPGERKGEKGDVETAYLSIYAQSFVSPNPALGKSHASPQFETDENGVPLLKIWNAGEPYSLLNCPGKVTLVVKAFTVPARTRPTNTEKSVLEKLFSVGESAKLLDATAKQAHQLAESLRSPEMAQSLQKRGLPVDAFETYVLHASTGSMVTVGSFESVDDPRLQQTQRVLESLTFQIADTPGGPPTRTERMFATVFPMGVPKLP